MPECGRTGSRGGDGTLGGASVIPTPLTTDPLPCSIVLTLLMVPGAIDSRPVSGAMPVGASTGTGKSGVDARSSDRFDGDGDVRGRAGAGRLTSTGCTTRSGAQASSVLGAGSKPGANSDVARSAPKTIAWAVTERTTKDDRR